VPTYLSPGVYVEEIDSGSRPIEGVGTAVAAFVGLAEKGPMNQPTRISNWGQYSSTFGEFIDGSYLAPAVYSYFLQGGGSCYIVRIGAAEGASTSAAAQLVAGGKPAYRIEALEAGPDGNDLTVEIIDSLGGSSGGGSGSTATPPSPEGATPSDDSFKVVVRRNGQVAEEFDGLTTKSGRQNIATKVNADSKLIRLIQTATGAIERPANTAVGLAGGTTGAPDRLEPRDYVGDVGDRTGFGGLEAIDEITMVCVPDLMSAFEQQSLDLEGVKAVQLAMIAHCELMGDRMAILDPPPGMNAQQVHDWRVNQAGYDSRYAALYYPWIKVFDPLSGANKFIPPSGAMAGIWGRNDDSRGVHKAPANEVVRGAVSVELELTSREQELLNPAGINCIRSFPGRGIRVWGARTVSSDPAWRYLNVRRFFNYLEESILGGTQWVVFEPNDDTLWSKIRRTIAAFLVNEWRKGALFGLTPDEAFYVKCDRETNPAESIDAGLVICEIGVAPVKPAEFVVFRLSQFSGGASLVE
jgi:phage tail sheath protein FI